MASSETPSGIKIVGNIVLPEIKRESERLKAAGTSTRILPNGFYTIDHARKWQVGAVIFFDTKTNHFGKLAVKARSRSDINFSEYVKLSERPLDIGDLVIFCVESGKVAEVIPASQVNNLPWSLILTHVGYYKEIDFQYTIDRRTNQKGTLTIPVIESLLRCMKDSDRPRMLNSLYHKLKSNASDEKRDEYLQEVLECGIQEVFEQKCLNHEYAESLLAENSPYLWQYFEIVSAILRKYIAKGDLVAAAGIYATFKGLDNTYGDFMAALNEKSNNWPVLSAIIRAFPEEKNGEDFFLDMIRSDSPVKPEPMVLLSAGMAKKTEPYNALLDAETLSKISNESILKILSRERRSEDTRYLLGVLPEERAQEIVATAAPDSEFAKKYIQEKWKKASAISAVYIDIESDGAEISEAVAIEALGKVVESRFPTELPEVLNAITTSEVIIGHNIKSWDLPILKRKGLSLKENQIIWDTYEWEMVLSPTRSFYALATEHNAVEDARLCQTLFWNQLYRIIEGGDALAHVQALVPDVLRPFLERISAKEFEPFLMAAAVREKTFFREAVTIAPALGKDLSSLKGRILILAPQELWPVIASHVDASFPTATDPQFLCLNAQAVAGDASLDPQAKAILETFVKSSPRPMPVNLSRAARRILTDKVLTPFLMETDSPDLPICTDMFGLESLGDLQALGIKAIYTTGYEFESRNNRMKLGEPFCAADLLKSVYGAKLLMQLSGAHVVPILADECPKLGLPEIPAGAKNIWMHKDEKGLFQVYCNRSFDELMGTISERYPGIPQNSIQWVYSETKEAKITLAATSRNSRFDARMKRVNPASRYRSMYWVYQFALIDGIASSGVKVLYVTNPLEVDPVRNYAISRGYFVPEKGASVQRQVELCAANPSQKKIVVVGTAGFKTLRESKIESQICLLWDNLDIESLQVMWKGLLPFGDEPEYEAERKEGEEGIPSTLSCVLGVWPMVKYYYHQLKSQNPENSIWLLDPSFDDYRELEKSFLIGRQEISLWDSEDAYKEARMHAQQFFAGKKHEDDMPGSDYETAREIIRQIFLDPKVKNGRAEWTPIQEKALPQVYRRQGHSLVCIPTGGGKSVLFQGPALYRAAFTNRLSIVITPLKALMQDQVSGLQALGFLTNVDYLNSDKSRPETSRIYRKITGGEIALLYVTPERFRSKGFRNALELRMEADDGLEYIIFDEAHCISQWGLDFRPEYLSTALTCAKMVERFPDTRIELFSATVTGQVRDNIEEIIRPLTGVGTDEPYNPVRNHIGMEFRPTADNVDGRTDALYEEIEKSGFDPEKSRMLVFSRTRKMAEEVCELLIDKLKESSHYAAIAEKVGYFHAGMEAEDRSETFDKFHDGEYVILIATKAFGMGMDIPNIHYVFHLSPPQFIEDYLQEVGRAGRNKEQYESAGFSPDRPIPTKCFVSPEDFQNLRSLLVQGAVSWEDVRSIYTAVKEFVLKFQPKGDNTSVPIAVPDNIWKKDKGQGEEADPTAFRLGLYWLERMGRIKMGYYASTTLDIALPEKHAPAPIWDKDLKGVYGFILTKSRQLADPANVQININEICSSLSIGQNSLFRYIIQGTNQGLFSVVNRTAFSLTKLRTDEVRYSLDNRHNPIYVIDAVFEATRLLLSGLTVRKEAEKVDIQKRNAILEEAIASCGVIDVTDLNKDKNHMPWYAVGGTGISTKKTYIRDLSFNRAKHLFDIIDMLPGTSVKSIIDRDDKQVVQEVYLSSGAWVAALSRLKADTVKMLRYLAERSFRNERDFVWTEAIRDLNLPESYQYISDLISILRMFGFINADGLLSTGIEISLTDRQEEIQETPSVGFDKTVYNSFTDVNSLKDLKFSLMDTFHDVPKEKFDEFIQYYFSCKNREDYMALLSLFNSEDSDRMKAFQRVAIKTQEDRLDKEQRAIYDESIDKDINVIAGPGSGKTHVLTLRCAKLVYYRNVPSRNILVLAYNRAVVEELKSRLSRLFTELGHGRSMSSQLQIYTFHGLAKKYCYQRVQDLEPEQWEQTFLEYISDPSTRGTFRAAMGNVQYILIDEFQDITQVRIELIRQLRKLLTRGSVKPKLFTIGDVNQSIYGFEKYKQGFPMDPMYYYAELRKSIKPQEMYMRTNYRSYQGILDAAFKFIPGSDPGLLPHSSETLVPPEGQYVMMRDRVSWYGEFPQLVKYFQGLNEKTEDERRQVRSLAVFFRNNNEVYRGYARLREMGLQNVRIRVQGSSGEFFRTRECFSLILELRSKADIVISLDTKQQVRNHIEYLRKTFPAWDSYYLDLTYALAVDFLSSVSPGSMTYGDMAEYLEDMGGKDDGQLSKILQKHRGELPARDDKLEIILTTMHKVKGLEFDAVVITPSFQPLGYDWKGNLEKNWQDLVGEERRLYYVAYTRAKKYLFAYRDTREMCVEAGQTFMPNEELLNRLGHSFDQGFDKFNIGFTAKNFSVNNLLASQVRRNDRITLMRNSFGDGWNVVHIGSNGRLSTVGKLSQSECGELNKKIGRDINSIQGFFVSDVYVWRYEDTLRHDRRKNRDYAKDWSPEAIKQGFIFIADIAGFTGA